MKNRQKGFGIVEILVVIVVIGLVGVTGWQVYDKQKSSKRSLANQDTSEKTKMTETSNNSSVGTNLSSEKETVKVVTITNKKFSVSLPTDWNYLSCMDHDGLGVLVGGGDGEIRCIWDDATWLGADMAASGKVAIGYSSSPYPRQDWSSGKQKDVYDTDAEELLLSDGRTVMKYTYSAEEKNNKGKTFKVVEYKIEDTVTVFVFDGHTQENTYINELSTEEIVKIVEETILPSVKLV